MTDIRMLAPDASLAAAPVRARPGADRLTRLAYLLAPALLLAYGVARLIDGMDGSYGPGPAWTIGHLFFLAGLILFGVVLVGLRRQTPRFRIIATGAVGVGLVGLLAFVRGIVIDLIVGSQGINRADMDRIYPHYDGWPGGMPRAFTGVLDNVGPALFIVGLLALTIQLAIMRPRPLAWWSPVLVALGFALINVDLDLLPAGAAALLLALLPMARPSHRTDQPHTAAT
jgi:hypothetical protein